MTMDEFEKRQAIDRLRSMLPDYIMECGLAEAGFTSDKGGKFRCPSCGHTIALYSDKSSGTWRINTFGKCDHFGYHGDYPSDAAGILLAMEGKIVSRETLAEANSRLLGNTWTQTEHVARFKEIEEKRKESVIVREANVEKNREIVRHNVAFGDNIPPEGQALLKKRGIEISSLSPYVKEHIGFAHDVWLNKLSEDGKYSVSAVMFALGSKNEKGEYVSWQGRKVTSDKSDFEKGSVRFVTVGDSNVFMPELIDEFIQAKDTLPIFITEGPFDCLSYHVLGAKCISVQGAGNREYVIQRFTEGLKEAGKKTIVLDYDHDTAGQSGGQSLFASLSAISPDALILRHPGYYTKKDCKDANDFLQKYEKTFRVQIQIFNEVASQYNAGLLTAKCAQALVDSMEGTRRLHWTKHIIPALKLNRRMMESYINKDGIEVPEVQNADK